MTSVMDRNFFSSGVEGLLGMAKDSRGELEELADLLAQGPVSRSDNGLYLAVALTLALLEFIEQEALNN
ncbi:MAG: hypothetical protein MI923_16365 [Phycisphaerales bacterium]|nr:hypothetical protein [Phycisphaerales bacterium]